MGLLSLLVPDIATIGLTLAVAVAVYVVRVYIFPSKLRRMTDKFPGPVSYPIFGTSIILEREGYKVLDQLTGWARKYGGIWRFWLGHHPAIVVSTAQAAEDAFRSTTLNKKSILYSFLWPWLGTGLLTSWGTKWKTRRRLLTPTFHHQAMIKDFSTVFQEHSKGLIKQLEAKASGEVFDVFPYITRCTLDIICEAAMGINLNSQDLSSNQNDEYVKAVYDISAYVHLRQKQVWLWPDIFFHATKDGKMCREAVRIAHEFTNKAIADRRAKRKSMVPEGEDSENPAGKKGKRLAFLDLLLESTGEDGNALTDADIREEVDTFMFEGHDTTAAAIAWTLHLLGDNPEAQKKAQEEVDRVVSGDSPTFEELSELTYLDMVAKESLRLYPSVPGIGREVTEEGTTIDGKPFPVGAMVLVLIWCIHRDPEVWPEPEKFDPERFTVENSKGRHPYAHVPFSAGPRNCIGQRFAKMEEKVTLAAILKRFNIASTMETTMEGLKPEPELILRPRDGIKIKLTPRN